ncbi:hypothetical protein ABKN59_001363 [Abortiporus biennis]
MDCLLEEVAVEILTQRNPKCFHGFSEEFIGVFMTRMWMYNQQRIVTLENSSNHVYGQSRLWRSKFSDSHDVRKVGRMKRAQAR